MKNSGLRQLKIVDGVRARMRVHVQVDYSGALAICACGCQGVSARVDHVSLSVRRCHSPSLSPRLTVTGRDPSNYLFLDHMQMAKR